MVLIFSNDWFDASRIWRKIIFENLRRVSSLKPNKTRSISLLVYPTTPNFLDCTQFLITLGSMHSVVVHSI